ITQMGQHFLTLLQSGIEDPAANIQQLPLLSKAEHHDMVHKFNRGPDVAIADQCIHQLFEWRVAQSSDDVAVEFGDEALTYSQLNRKANQLAVYLRIKGVGRGTLVGLCVARSFELQIAILAVLKAGGAYVPFDPNNPPSRLLYMVEDSAISLMLTNTFENKFSERFDIGAILKDGGCEGIETLNLDEPQVQQQLNQLSSRNSSQNHSDEISSSDAAYIIYTSGTTGNPKGVVQHHQTITNLVHGLAVDERLGKQLKTLQFSPASFDISLQEMATCWLNNSALVYISEHDKQTLVNLPDIILKQGIERLYFPPAVLLWLAETAIERGLSFPLLQEISAAGDSLNITEHLSEFMHQHPNCTLWNSYGPTEMHVVTTALIDDYSVGAQPSIGKFIANTKGYIVNPLRSIQPRGAVGELYLAGAGMAKGYLNRPKLTSQLFFDNALVQSERIYKTGDLVRMLPDGSLAYMGRVDEQVQIRGLRVELGEIESQLA
ncbi:MAG: amino acid adenylation domain-containing protein, partial [Psychrosphaera sp.]|nr:amino acid adenylation domain-containing protein [Psychrosphaera sp.]